MSKSGMRAAGYIEYYNNVRLRSANGHMPLKHKLEGRENEIFSERDRKFEAARGQRKLRRRWQRRKASTLDKQRSFCEITRGR